MKSNKQYDIKEIVDKIKLMKWRNLNGSLEAVERYRHLFLERENGATSFEIDMLRISSNEFK